MIAQDLGVNLETIAQESTQAPTPSPIIKIKPSAPAPPSEGCCHGWMPLLLTIGALGLVAAYVIAKKK